MVDLLANTIDAAGPERPTPLHLGPTKTRLPRTLRDHVRSASALSALKNSLVANLSAKWQLSVAKLSAKRIFSLAKRDFLVANGRMAADFSSPENSGPKFKFRLLRSLVKLITFQNFKPKRVNKSEMLQNFSQTQGTVFHSSACISSSEGFFKNRSAHFCGKSPSSGACPSQIAILLSLGLKFLMK